VKERFESFVCNGEEVIVEAAMERADIFFSKLCETVERKTEGRNVLVIYFLEEREGERDKVREFYFYFFFFNLVCFYQFWSFWASLFLLGRCGMYSTVRAVIKRK
jgi:hypothetical protein